MTPMTPAITPTTISGMRQGDRRFSCSIGDGSMFSLRGGGGGASIQTDGATSDRVAEYERCFELFDGNDSQAVDAARGRWQAYKDAGHALTYWQQTVRGGWEEKG